MLLLIRVFNCLAFYFSLIPILSPTNPAVLFEN